MPPGSWTGIESQEVGWVGAKEREAGVSLLESKIQQSPVASEHLIWVSYVFGRQYDII
jgi:hypothetical protein